MMFLRYFSISEMAVACTDGVSVEDPPGESALSPFHRLAAYS